MPSANTPPRPLSTTLALVALWFVFYASFTLFTPALLDDADSVHAEVAREMLLRHDYITLYANGIRYLEKAPLLYWSMALSMRIAQLLGHPSARALAVAARIPLALTVLALAFAVEAFARRSFRNARTGLYAALILLSSPGIFLFTRITLPDAMLCLWLTLALLAFYLTEYAAADRVILTLSETKGKNPRISSAAPSNLRLLCYAFAACCALGILTKGLIGAVFPIAIVLLYLLLTRRRRTVRRILELHPFSSTAVFLAIAAPWHILIALANPTRGNPGGLTLTHRHLSVPLPTPGNVHGWAWFYFVNEQVLRYLNLRVPRDYDTVPLWLFWGLILIWLMPWSAFLFHAIARTLRNVRASSTPELRSIDKPVSLKGMASAVPQTDACDEAALAAEVTAVDRVDLLLLLWAALPLLFFSLSTRQEYYVLPALPAIAILIGAWLPQDSLAGSPPATEAAKKIRRSSLRCTAVLFAFGTIFAAAALFFLLRTRAAPSNADLAALLQQNPGDYAMSMGHFLDLNAQALSLFRLPLALAAAALFLGPLVSLILRNKNKPHAANISLAAGAFGFLLAAHLGLQTFAPVLTSAQLAQAIAPQVLPGDLIVIHQEYEYGSTLGFYLQRPTYAFAWSRPAAVNPLHILEGRSSNLWYGSFFPDAPAIFETPQSLAQKWRSPQRIFLWQDLANQPSPLPASLDPVYVIAKSGGKEIVSNQPNR